MVAGKSQGQVKPWQQNKQAQHLNSKQLHDNHHFFLKYPQERVALDNGMWFIVVIVGFANVCHITLLIFINLPHKGEGEGVGWRMMKVDEGHEWFKSSLRFHREVQQLFHFPGCWRKNLSYWDALTAVDVGPFSACDLGHDAQMGLSVPRVSGCLWTLGIRLFGLLLFPRFCLGMAGWQRPTASNSIQRPTANSWQMLTGLMVFFRCR